MKKIFVIIICLIIAGSFASDSSARRRKKKWVKSKYGLKALMELSGDRKNMEKTYKKETRTYKKALEAVKDNCLTKGMTAKQVIKRVGEPVIDLKEKGGTETRWVYKKGTADYSSSEKVYLFFDNDNKLLRWQIPQAKTN